MKRLRIGIGAVVTTRTHKGALVVAKKDENAIVGKVLRRDGSLGSRIASFCINDITSYQLRLPEC